MCTMDPDVHNNIKYGKQDVKKGKVDCHIQFHFSIKYKGLQNSAINNNKIYIYITDYI